MQYLSSDMAQIQVDEEAARRRQEQAQRLMQAGFNPVPNANPILSILASVMSTIKGDSMLKDSDAKLSETLAKRFEIQNQQDQAKAEAEQRRRGEDYQRELEKLRAGEKYKAEFRAPEKVPFEQQLFNMLPENLRGQAALGKFGLGPKAGPGPSESDRKIAQLRALGATDDQIRSMLLGGQSRNIDPLSPEGIAAQTKLKGATTAAAGADPKAAAAAQAREILATLEQQIPASGPIDGRLPTPGAQSFDRTVAQLVNPFQTLTRIPGQGSQSDAELKRLMDSFPAVTNFESVNKESIANLRSYLDKIQGMQGGAAQTPPPAAAQGGIGSIITGPDGRKYRIIGGDPNDPDVEPVS